MEIKFFCLPTLNVFMSKEKKLEEKEQQEKILHLYEKKRQNGEFIPHLSPRQLAESRERKAFAITMITLMVIGIITVLAIFMITRMKLI
jgi:hypothetical protein